MLYLFSIIQYTLNNYFIHITIRRRKHRFWTITYQYSFGRHMNVISNQKVSRHYTLSRTASWTRPSCPPTPTARSSAWRRCRAPTSPQTSATWSDMTPRQYSSMNGFNKDLSVDSVLCLKFSQLEVYFSFSHAKLPSCPSASVITISLTLTCF